MRLSVLTTQVAEGVGIAGHGTLAYRLIHFPLLHFRDATPPYPLHLHEESAYGLNQEEHADSDANSGIHGILGRNGRPARLQLIPKIGHIKAIPILLIPGQGSSSPFPRNAVP